MKKLVASIMMAVMLFAGVAITGTTAGCAKVHDWFSDNETNLMVAVHLATAITIDKHPEWSDDIVKIVTDAQALIGDGTATSLDMLDQFLMSKIVWTGMTNADKVVVMDLINQIHSNIEKYFVTAGINDPAGQMVEVRKVLGWVLEVANQPVVVKQLKSGSYKKLN